MASFADLLKGGDKKPMSSEEESRKKREAEAAKAEAARAEARRKAEVKRGGPKGYKAKNEENLGAFADWLKGDKK